MLNFLKDFHFYADFFVSLDEGVGFGRCPFHNLTPIFKVINPPQNVHIPNSPNLPTLTWIHKICVLPCGHPRQLSPNRSDSAGAHQFNWWNAGPNVTPAAGGDS